MSKGSNRRPGDDKSFASNFDNIFSGKIKRGSFIYDPELGEMVPKSEYIPRQINGPMVMGDISEYRSMATGEMITSRSKHREHLRQHGLVEVGNETKYLKNKPKEHPKGLRDKIAREVYQRLS